MELFIIRHAWAAERGDPNFTDEATRPLTDKGRDRFTCMASTLVPRGLAPQLIATSPILRCVQTAEILAAAGGGKAKLFHRNELLPGGDPKHLLAWTEEHAAGLEQIAWVGHAPDVGHLIAALIGLDNGWLEMKKGAIAAVDFPESPELGRGELRWLVNAKILGL
jgi:phosphohistidine phosphatase